MTFFNKALCAILLSTPYLASATVEYTAILNSELRNELYFASPKNYDTGCKISNLYTDEIVTSCSVFLGTNSVSFPILKLSNSQRVAMLTIKDHFFSASNISLTSPDGSITYSKCSENGVCSNYIDSPLHLYAKSNSNSLRFIVNPPNIN